MKQRYIAALLAEAVGTFTLVLVVLNINRYGLPIFTALGAGLTVATFVSAFGKVSGGHFNPAVSISLFSIRQLSLVRMVGYVVAQFVAAVGAWRLYEYFTDTPLKNSAASSTFDWRIFLAEAVGTMVFMFGVTSVVMQKQKGWQQSATIGFALFLGITVAGLASLGVCNPAVALGIRNFDLNYFLGPLAGGVFAAVVSVLVIYPVFGAKKDGATPVVVSPSNSSLEPEPVAKPATVKKPVASKSATKPVAKSSAKPTVKKASGAGEKTAAKKPTKK